MMIDRVKMYLS